MRTVHELTDSRFFLLFLSALVALAPLSIDAYLPALPQMASYYGVDLAAANLTLSTFLLGSAIGQFFGGSLSDQLGRKPIGLLGLGIYILSTLLIIFATSIEQVQLLRISQAIGGGFASVICMAQVRDVFPVAEVGKKYANVILVVLVAPLVAPTLGAALSQFGWQIIFGFLCVYATIWGLIYWRMMPETHTPPAAPFSIKALFSGYLYVLNHRAGNQRLGLKLLMFSSFGAGTFMSLLTNASFIYMEFLGFGEFSFALVFALGGIALMSGNRIAARLMGRFDAVQVLRSVNGVQILMLFGLLLLVGAGIDTFWLVLSAMMLLLLTQGLLMPTTAGKFISLFERNAGSASSLNASLTFLFGSVIGGISALLAQGNLLPIVAVMLVSAVSAGAVLLTVRR